MVYLVVADEVEAEAGVGTEGSGPAEGAIAAVRERVLAPCTRFAVVAKIAVVVVVVVAVVVVLKLVDGLSDSCQYYVISGLDKTPLAHASTQ